MAGGNQNRRGADQEVCGKREQMEAVWRLLLPHHCIVGLVFQYADPSDDVAQTPAAFARWCCRKRAAAHKMLHALACLVGVVGDADGKHKTAEWFLLTSPPPHITGPKLFPDLLPPQLPFTPSDLAAQHASAQQSNCILQRHFSRPCYDHCHCDAHSRGVSPCASQTLQAS